MIYQNITQPTKTGTTIQSILGTTLDTDYIGFKEFEGVEAERYLGGGRVVLDVGAELTLSVFLGGQSVAIAEIPAGLREFTWFARVKAIDSGDATVDVFWKVGAGALQWTRTEGIPTINGPGAIFMAFDIKIEQSEEANTEVLVCHVH